MKMNMNMNERERMAFPRGADGIYVMIMIILLRHNQAISVNRLFKQA